MSVRELKLTPELRKQIRDYHLGWHGDTKCRVVRVVYSEDGVPAILVRTTNVWGVRWSCLDYRDMLGDVFELYSAWREDEDALVAWYEGNGAWDANDYIW